jgi:hypothetical protein
LSISEEIKAIKAQKEQAAQTKQAQADAKFQKANGCLASFYNKLHHKLSDSTDDGGDNLKPPNRGVGCGIGQPKWMNWVASNMKPSHLWGRSAKCPKGPEIDAYVRSRTSKIWPTPGYSASKKGSEADFKAGKTCLVKQAMALRSEPDLWAGAAVDIEATEESGGGAASGVG